METQRVQELLRIILALCLASRTVWGQPAARAGLCVLGSPTSDYNQELSRCAPGDNLLIIVEQGTAMVNLVAGLCDLSKTVVTYSNAAICVFQGVHAKR